MAPFFLCFVQILLGLRDTSDAIVASSFRALADLVPLLGGDTVIGGPRKTFFFHGLPKVKWFVCVCLCVCVWDVAVCVHAHVHMFVRASVCVCACVCE